MKNPRIIFFAVLSLILLSGRTSATPVTGNCPADTGWRNLRLRGTTSFVQWHPFSTYVTACEVPYPYMGVPCIVESFPQKSVTYRVLGPDAYGYHTYVLRTGLYHCYGSWPVYRCGTGFLDLGMEHRWGLCASRCWCWPYTCRVCVNPYVYPHETLIFSCRGWPIHSYRTTTPNWERIRYSYLDMGWRQHHWQYIPCPYLPCGSPVLEPCIPEPATIALLGLGGLALLRRRRR